MKPRANTQCTAKPLMILVVVIYLTVSGFEQKNLLEIYAMIFVTFRFYKYYGYMDTEKCIQSIFNAYLIYIKNEFGVM